MSFNFGYHINQEVVKPYKKITVIPIKSSYMENLTSNYLKMSVNDYTKILNGRYSTFSRTIINIMKVPAMFGNGTKIKKVKSVVNYGTADFSFYEVLPKNHYIKIFLDIENIPMDEPDIIDNIIRDFKKFTKDSANVDINLIALTLNTNSISHEGRSYHVIYDVCTEIFNMRNMICWFLWKFPHYKNFVDSTVYSRNRLFKSINQININHNVGKSNPNDKHNLIRGTIEDSIIQNVNNIKSLGFEYYATKIKQSTKNFSRDDKHDHEDHEDREDREDRSNSEDRNDDDMQRTKTDSIEDVILKTKPVIIITDEEIKGLIIGTEMKKLNQKQQEFINDLKLHFEQHNTFDDYKYSRECLKSILNTIH